MTIVEEVKNIGIKQTVAILWNQTELTKAEKEVIHRHCGFEPIVKTPQGFDDISKQMELKKFTVMRLYIQAVQKLRMTFEINDLSWKGRMDCVGNKFVEVVK